ncbi:META domain-containing protein [Streptomyces sp. NPDC006368]|uniref:META domain-containing protein n=1 Tax=Streptomyces sp. NPDC006368 TaxID=3156760 RepID=UPI0033AC29BB
MSTTQKQHLTAAAALAPLLALALAACGGQKGSGAGDGGGSDRPDLPVTGVHWAVDSVTVDGRKSAAPPGSHVEIDVKGQATGTYGCNHFNAKATVDGDTITLRDAGMTEMACPEPVQAFENALKSALDGTLRAKLDGDRLTLTTSGGDTVQLTEQPPAPLVSTEWTVDSLTEDGTATSLPAGARGKARFVFGEDGSVRGTLGCNRFSAKAAVDGGTITFGPAVTTRKLCPGAGMDLERALLKVMTGKVTYTIDDRTLTLTAPDGTGFAANATAK